MTDTLFDLTLKVGIELGIIRQTVATGGSTTTAVDSTLLATLDDDYYEQGTCWITDTTDDLAPEKEMSIVSGFTGATGTVTLQDELTVALASGDRFAVGAPRYKLFELIQQINNSLYLDGYIPGTDETLTTVANQREYTLPQVATLDLRQVWITTNQGDDDRTIPRPVYNYIIKHSITGTPDTLVLNQDYAAGYTLILIYAAQHGALQIPADELNDSIHPDRIVFDAAANAMRAYRDRTRLKHLEASIELLQNKAELAKQRHPLPTLPGRQSKITIIGRRTMESGFFGGRS